MCAAALAALAMTLLAAKPAEEAVDIGSRLELFVDGFLIDRLAGATLELHPPRPAGKVLAFDAPWEGVTSSSVVVFRDGERFRMYYRGSSPPGYVIPSQLRPGETVVPDHPEVACYAESCDGITWTKPALGLFEFRARRRTT